MLTVWLVLGYLIAHFAGYALLLRRFAPFQKELGIFLFHFASACLLPPAVFWLNLSLDLGVLHAILLAVLAAAAHGIYSLSFLEIWALADGSFSYVILRAIQERPAAGREEIVSQLDATGGGKRDHRLQSLHRLRLTRQDDRLVSLTPRGRAVVAVLKILRRLANVSESA